MLWRKGRLGIGLYRTEFLYLASEKEPTEDDHYAALCGGDSEVWAGDR